MANWIRFRSGHHHHHYYCMVIWFKFRARKCKPHCRQCLCLCIYSIPPPPPNRPVFTAHREVQLYVLGLQWSGSVVCSTAVTPHPQPHSHPHPHPNPRPKSTSTSECESECESASAFYALAHTIHPLNHPTSHPITHLDCQIPWIRSGGISVIERDLFTQVLLMVQQFPLHIHFRVRVSFAFGNLSFMETCQLLISMWLTSGKSMLLPACLPDSSKYKVAE